MVTVLTRREMTLARKALRYARGGIPIKDAFETGYEQDDLVVALLAYAVEREGK